jgi:heptosyltransferase-1
VAPRGDRPLRVLIVRIGAMGDVLHAMPAVAALRERHPEWRIGWAIEPAWRELFEAESECHDVAWRFSGRNSRRPLIDLWSAVPTRAWKRRPLSLSTLRDIADLRRELRRDHYDICVDMQGSIRSAMVGRMAEAKMFAGAAATREAPAAWLYRRKIRLSATHVVEQGCELLGAAVGEALQPAKVTLPVDTAAEEWCDQLLADVEVLGRAGFRTLVNAASLEDKIARRVVEASGGAAMLVPCSIGQMIALVRRAGAVIAGDTGPLHLAAVLERPVVALFGPTDPARSGPYGTSARVLRHGSSQVDHSRHPGTEKGLMQITVDEVVGAALELLCGEKDNAEQNKVKM